MRENNTFVSAVHRLQRKQGLRLRDVAARTMYSESYLSKMLNGHRPLLPAPVHEMDLALAAGGELDRLAAERRGKVAALPLARLPHGVQGLVGRSAHVHAMDQALVTGRRPEAVVTMAIEGGFWVGKTALAVHWANRVADGFPGGCLFADLRGQATGEPVEPGDVLNIFLTSLGAGADLLHGPLKTRAARYRSLLAKRPALVVLDNIASYEQIEHLLPPGGSALVVTSRDHQSDLLRKTDGLCVDLLPLDPGAATDLLRLCVGEARVNVDLSAVEDVARCCGYLPMALSIAAGHLLQQACGSFRELADGLAVESGRLDLLTSQSLEVDVREAIDRSYLALPSIARRVFRLLGISPAPLIGTASTAVLAEVSQEQAREALALLRDAHLLEDAHAGRMRMNYLLRSYAFERGLVEEPLAEVERVRDRLLCWYVATAYAASNVLLPNWSGAGFVLPCLADAPSMTFVDSSYEVAFAWCTAEVETVIHLVRHARSREVGEALWWLPTMFLPYFYLAKNWGAWLTAASEGLAAARDLGCQEGIARSAQSLGWVLGELGRPAEAIQYLEEAISLQTESGDDWARAWSLFGIATAYTEADRHADAREAYLLAETLFARVRLPLGEVVTRAMISLTYQCLGRPDEAAESAHAALDRARELSAKPVIGLAHHRLGLVLLRQRRYRAALTHFDKALSFRRGGCERWGVAESLVARAKVLAAMNDPIAACESYRDAARILKSESGELVLDIQARIASLSA